MSDLEQRDLERRALVGTPDDRARWLAARLRAGLDPARVRLAAHAQDEGARLALGLSLEPTAAGLVEWCRGFEPFGPESATRAAIAAARCALPTWEALAPGSIAPREAVAAAEEWVRHGLDERVRRRAEDTAYAAADAFREGKLFDDYTDEFGSFPWGPLRRPEELASAREEFRREVAAPNSSRVRDLEPFARGDQRSDDLVGFVVEAGVVTRRVVEVHLTWTRSPPEADGWPSLGVTTLPEWVGGALREIEDEVVRSAVAAATAAALVVVPGGAHHGFERLAACARCAGVAVGDEARVREAMKRDMVEWALGITG